MMAWISEKIILHVKGQIKKSRGQKNKKVEKTAKQKYMTFSPLAKTD